jgi:hypothetical protein
MTKDLAIRSQFVALTPADVAPAQASLADWCTAKMRELGHDYRDLLSNLTIAKRNRWRTTALIPAVKKLKQRIQYYQKMRVAVQAGYVMMPNLPIEVIAVRVARAAPQRKFVVGYPTKINEAQPELIPADTGRYVDDTLPHEEGDRNRYDSKGMVMKDSHGNVITEPWARTDSYDETIDFPMTLVKPIILEATEHAMRRYLFDRIGIAFGEDTSTIASATRRRADPIVIGQLIDPRSTKYNKRMTSFFIAWWLDPNSL